MPSGPSTWRTAWRDLDARARLRIGLAGSAVLAAVLTFAACGGCGKRAPAGGAASAGQASSSSSSGGSLEADAAVQNVPLLWSSAKEGEAEDLAALAAHEGALGLVEAAGDAALRSTAIRAMGYAHGWAQLPFLAKTASGKDDDEARLALDASLELAIRPRTSEDPEDADELREGCESLVALARDSARPRPRRVAAARVLRMIPCPPRKAGEELPSDLDAK
jgi:hypothetical protein